MSRPKASSEQNEKESKTVKEFCQKLEEQNNELKKEINELKKEIKEIKEKYEIIGNKKLFSCIKFEKHPCYLILVDSANKDKIYDECGKWVCNECKNSYMNQIPNFYCPKCNYDLCLDCLKNN